MRQVWRVRWWVRALAVAVLVLAILFSFVWPHLLNPDWRDGLPSSEVLPTSIFLAVLASLMLASFRARVELTDGTVRVINPWSFQTFPARSVKEVRPGPYGAEFVLRDGRVISAFAVQTTRLHAGSEPRWVQVARAVTGRDPEAS